MTERTSPFLALLETARARIHSPVAIVLGAPRLAATLAGAINQPGTVCYQMDLFQTDRLREELSAANIDAEVRSSADLWDLPPEFATVVFPAPARSERELKIDLVEQAFHVLRPKGRLIVLSTVESDTLFPKQLKKVFGRSSVTSTDGGTVIWATRDGDQPRRRHELMVQARVAGEESIRFLTRPGVFTYGKLDEGARALMEVAEFEPDETVLDLGCGAGANGLIAGRRVGPGGRVTFIDSNLRATALATENAKAVGLENFDVVADPNPENLPANRYDVVLTNPPYYAQQEIAQRFLDAARRVLKPGGRCYLVTRQLDLVEPRVTAVFGESAIFENRGYYVLVATKGR
jgi:16S rRNA (guanine1207-N2)-methyltransferase